MRVLTVPVLAMLAVSCADLTNRPPINEGFFSDALDGPNERLCVRTTTPERPLTDGQALSASAIIVCSPSGAGGEAIEPPPNLRIDIRTEKAENVVLSADGIFHAESGHIAGLWATISSSAASEEFTGDLYWLPDAGSESHTLPDAALAGYGLAYSGLFIDGCLTPETVELTLEAHVNFVMPPEPHLGEVSLSDTVPTTGYYTYGFTIRATEEAEGGEEDNVSDYVISGYAWAYCTGVDTLDLD